MLIVGPVSVLAATSLARSWISASAQTSTKASILLPTTPQYLLAVGNLALFRWPRVHLLGAQYRLFDIGGAIGLMGMGLMLIAFTLQNTVRLYREERISE